MHKQSVFKHILTAGIISLLSLSLVSFSPVSSQTPPASQGARFEEQILQYVNQYRQSKSLAPLKMNEAISAEALKHSTSMAGGKTAFGHDGFDGRVDAIRKQLASTRKFAENVAYGHLDAKAVVDVWLDSPGHRRNIEGTYNITGIGTAKRADGTIFFTQIFVTQ